MRGLTGAQRSSFPRYSRLKFEIFLQTLSHFSITILKISGMLCIYVRSEREVINIMKHDIPEISFSGDKKKMTASIAATKNKTCTLYTRMCVCVCVWTLSLYLCVWVCVCVYVYQVHDGVAPPSWNIYVFQEGSPLVYKACMHLVRVPSCPGLAAPPTWARTQIRLGLWPKSGLGSDQNHIWLGYIDTCTDI